MALALWEKRTQRLKLCRSCALLGGQVATKKIGGDAYKPGNSETQSIFSLETWRSFLPIRMIRMIRMIPPNFSWLLDQKHVSWFLANVFVRHLFVSKVSKGHLFFHSKTLKKTLASFGRSKVSKSHSRQIFCNDVTVRLPGFSHWRSDEMHLLVVQNLNSKKKQNAWSLRFAFGPIQLGGLVSQRMLVFFSKIPSSQCLMYVITNWNSSWVKLSKIPSSVY